MEDFHAAGGMPALLWELRDLLHLDARDVTGTTLSERLTEPVFVDRRYIRAPHRTGLPRWRACRTVRLACPARRHPQAQRRHARTVRDRSPRSRVRWAGRPRRTASTTRRWMSPRRTSLVLKNAGPLTPAGMPEAGYLPIPTKLARAGVKDMVRISDCRMSGTAFGTIVLHVTPEAAAGGPLALIETGDRIRLSVRERRIDLLVSDHELARRRAAWRAAARSRHAAGTGSWPSRCCRPTRDAIWRCCAAMPAR